MICFSIHYPFYRSTQYNMNFSLKLVVNLWLTVSLLLAGTTLFAQPCYISQPTSNAFANVSTATAAGQSFTACGDGVVTQVSMNITGLATTEFTFQMSSGANTLTPKYSQQLDVRENGQIVVLLDTPFPVTDGEVYAFSLIGVSGEGTLGNLQGFNGNPYEAGNTFTTTDGAATTFGADLQFSVSIVPAACTQAQRETNSFANVSNMVAAGQNFTACADGAITQLQFAFSSRDSSNFRLQLAAGDNTLTPTYVQDFTATSIGTQHVTLNTPFPVTAGDKFAFSIISLDEGGVVANLSGFNGNPYPDGNFFTTNGETVSNFGADALFAVTIVEMTCLINQPEVNAFFNSSSAISVGQSFTACKNGRVSHIRFSNQQGNLREIRLALSKGANTLEPDYSQTIRIEGAGDHLIPLFSHFNVLDGETYSFSITADGEETDNIFGFNGNPYPGGNAFTITDSVVVPFGTDLDFSILTFEDDGVVSVTEIEDLSINLKGAYPNPASGTVTIPYRLDQSRDVNILLYDVTGRNRKQIAKGQLPAGEYQEDVMVTDLPAGLYFYRIQTESGQSVTKRIVVQ